MDFKNISVILGQNLRYYRNKAAISQAEIAQKAKISLRLYSSIENGDSNPTLHTVLLLADAFQICPSSLLSLDVLLLERCNDSFINMFRSTFEGQHFACGVLTVDGRIIYANMHGQKLLEIKDKRLPNSIITINNFRHDLYESKKQQICSDRYRNNCSCSANIFDHRNSVSDFIRLYSFLILNSKGNEALFNVIYMVDINQDTHKNYYQFCLNLLKCVFKVQI